jgi:hypothetical protein
MKLASKLPWWSDKRGKSRDLMGEVAHLLKGRMLPKIALFYSHWTLRRDRTSYS